MTKQTHTPTPWILNNSGLIISKNIVVCHIGGVLKEDDAKHIVTCVNSHDALVECLKKLVSNNFKMLSKSDRLLRCHDAVQLLQSLEDEALKLAEGGV